MHFFARFAVLFGIPYSLLNLYPVPAFLQTIAQAQSALLNAAGIAATQMGTYIQTTSQLFQIVPSCTGLVMVFLMVALLYSTPIQNREKFAVFFSPVLFLFNQARLLAVLSVGTLYPALAEPVHAYLWFVDAALVLFLWFVAFSVDGEPMAPAEKKKGYNSKKRI